LSFTINELVDLGGAEVFAAGSVKWKGRGMELSEPRFAVLTLRDGLIVRVNGYRDRDEALEAAGLTK
jgi:ketosteroid isomerase-like protein